MDSTGAPACLPVCLSVWPDERLGQSDMSASACVCLRMRECLCVCFQSSWRTLSPTFKAHTLSPAGRPPSQLGVNNKCVVPRGWRQFDSIPVPPQILCSLFAILFCSILFDSMAASERENSNHSFVYSLEICWRFRPLGQREESREFGADQQAGRSSRVRKTNVVVSTAPDSELR